uniref:ADP-ribosyltransferase n=1 Tax=Streptomyces gossypiisoli TaxID=2748864 RepID=UPI0015DA2FC0
GALSAYATEIRPLRDRLKELKTKAQTFVDSVRDDDEWEYDEDKVGEHNQLRDDITATVAAFWAAERTCHNKITALWGGTQMVAGDGSERADQYGFSAEDMKNAKLPWGDPVEEKHHWYEVGHWVKSFVWDGLIVDGIWGTIKGLGTLVGFGGWEAMGQAWKGLAQLATGLALSSIPGVGTLFWALPDDKLPSWIRDSRTAMKETGKALVAWDEWGKNPARAAGAVTFNVLTTVFTGGAGAGVAGAGKAGAVARVLGTTARAIDPMTYIAKGAGASLSKIGDIATSLKGVGNIDIPTLPDGSVHLPDGRLMDTNGNLIAPNGAIDTTPVPHETGAPTGPTLPAHWTIQGGQQPVHAGVHAGDGMTHTADNVGGAGQYNSPPAHTGGPVPGGHFDPTSTSAPYGHAPSPSSYDHAPSPSAYDQTPTTAPHTGGGHPGGTPWYHQTADAHPAHDVPTTPHTGGPDVPGTGAHGTPDTPHSTGHDAPGGGHADDASHGAGHTDDVAHTGDHVDVGDHAGVGNAAVDAAAHHGTDAPVAPGHQGTDVPGGAGEPFEYKPHVSNKEWAQLSTAEKHRVAYAEISEGTVPFPRDTDAIAYGQAYWNDYADNMPAERKQAVWDYTDEPNYSLPAPHPDGWATYKEMNGYLRGDASKWSPYVQHNIDEVDSALAGHAVPEDLMVVRGTGIGHLKLDSPFDMLGKTYDDKGYMSTSLGNHPVGAFAGEEAILHLRVPKGTPALWVENVGKFGQGERELLLGRGTEYRVTRVFMENGQVQVYGEVLPRK